MIAFREEDRCTVHHLETHKETHISAWLAGQSESLTMEKTHLYFGV